MKGARRHTTFGLPHPHAVRSPSTGARHPMTTTTAGTAVPVSPPASSQPAPVGRAPWARARRVLTVALAVGILGLVVAAGVWRLEGGSWFSVRSPSMGVAAPVGTLVLTRPVVVRDLVVGDVITFHPPTSPDEIYTHRVVTVDASGVSTQGDINGAPDPWTVHQGDVLGRVTARWWGVGWVVRALPLLILGATLGWLTTRFVRRPSWRSSVRVLGCALLASYAITTLHPLVGITQIAAVTEAGATRVSLVSTGILPIQVHTSTPGGPLLDLRSGQTGVLEVHTGDAGRLDLTPGLHMPLSWWVAVIALWLTPLLYTLIVGVPRTTKAAGVEPVS